MSKIDKSKKFTPEVVNYVLRRKRSNPDISCRGLSLDASERFKFNISKSGINSLLKKAQLSSPIGRRVARIFRPAGEALDAGFIFLLGANTLLGLSKTVAKAIKKACPAIRIKDDALDAITEAWIMAKAIYSVPLERIENYSKNEIWFLLGRKTNKGLLARYIDIFEVLQTINNQLVTEFSHTFQDVHYMRFSLADGTQYFLDGQLKGVWSDSKIPLDFSVTVGTAEGYINSMFFGEQPIIVFNARPEGILPQDIANFVFSIDGSSSFKRIRKLELISPKGEVVKEVPFIVPGRRHFLIGVWPWQYKAISDLEKKTSQGRVYFEVLNMDFFFTEDTVRFSQHAHDIEVTLRLIVLKVSKGGPARLAILTNLDAGEWDTKRVVEAYVRRFPALETGYKLFISTAKTPTYFEDFITSEKLLAEAKKISDVRDPDRFFSVLVEILHLYAKRAFFPNPCGNWSFLKTKDIFYKQPGYIKRDLSDDILFKLFTGNMLQEKDVLNSSAVKFNESPLVDFSGRKPWILTS
jgi:hypothetical protein